MAQNNGSNYKWFLLALSALTNTFVGGLPFLCLPVLFQEISADLDLSLVQIGALWGMASLAGMFVALIGNSLASTNPQLAFLFWAALPATALFGFYFVKETGWRGKKGLEADVSRS